MATKKTKSNGAKLAAKVASEGAAVTKEIKKVTTEVEGAAGKASDEAKKELDAMVAAMKKDVKKEEGGKKKGKGGTSWGTFIVLLVLIILLGWAGCMLFQQYQANKLKNSLPEVIGYLGGDMTLQEITRFEYKGGVYEFEFTFEEYPDQPFTSYLSKDGKLFFVEGYPIEELKTEMSGGTGDGTETDPATTTPTATPESVSKSEAPELTAYIVADCPYGTQMQGVMVDAIEQAPEIADNFNVRYFFTTIAEDGSSYVAMHGAEEGMENARQICIREEQKPVYWDYVSCYAGGGTSETCMTQAGVDAAEAEECMAAPDRGVKFAKADNALSEGHNVTGSPTLILNDQEKVSESQFGGRNAQGLKTIVCYSADNALSFCDDTLSVETAAAAGNC